MHVCVDYLLFVLYFFFFFSSRRRHTRLVSDWSSDVCSSDLLSNRRLKFQISNSCPKHSPPPGSMARIDPSEIGRASCRERGVDLGGRRIMKKKIKMIREKGIECEN